MPLFPSLSDIIQNNPIHKKIGDMQAAIKNAKDDLHALSCSLKMDSTSSCAVASPPRVETNVKPAKVSDVTTVIPAKVLEVPTEEETLVELKKRLGKEIAKAENDLTNKLKIPKADGTLAACSCLSNKHNVVIEGLVEELMPKEPNNKIYSDIIAWFKTNEPKMTVQASASGKYDEEYIKFAGDLGGFRRRLGTGQGVPIQSAKDFLNRH